MGAKFTFSAYILCVIYRTHKFQMKFNLKGKPFYIEHEDRINFDDWHRFPQIESVTCNDEIEAANAFATYVRQALVNRETLRNKIPHYRGYFTTSINHSSR